MSPLFWASRLRMSLLCWLVVIAAGLGGLGAAQAADQPTAIPELAQRVTDQTGTLDAAQRAAIEQTLAALETEKGAQLAVLMVDTTGTESIEQYAVKVFETWRLGRANIDDGALLLIALSDRAMRIEVGYGLEGAVPDVIASRIIREQIAPHFKAGDFAGGVQAGVVALDRQIRGESLPAPQIRNVTPVRDAASDLMRGVPWEVIFFAVVVILAMPPWLAGIIGGILSYLMLASVFIVPLGFGLGFVGATVQAAMRKHSHSSTASRRGSTIGTMSTGGWSSGRSSGSSWGSSGGFSGGGGRSGGGGASGSW